MTLLEGGILTAERGDVVIFNNTSAEHPGTYLFVRDCAALSRRHGIPFFWVEYQTYEDARKGEWTRLDSYRLVNDNPVSTTNPDGYHWRGEVFEELVSWSGYLPNQFGRICTKHMKLEVTRAFLSDWLACREGIARLGHYGKTARVRADDLYRRHERNGGGVPKSIFLRKREYALGRPHVRPAQRYDEYCTAYTPFRNRALGRAYGGRASLGQGQSEYVAFVGLRADEPNRVERVRARNGPGSSGHAGEHVYMPLSDMGVARDDVNTFWEGRRWDLALPGDGALSNCVYCFLKGGPTLRKVHGQLAAHKHVVLPGFGPLAGTPCDVEWWARIEREYGRDLEAENRSSRTAEASFVGFAGTGKPLFEHLSGTLQRDPQSTQEATGAFANAPLPCDCTE